MQLRGLIVAHLAAAAGLTLAATFADARRTAAERIETHDNDRAAGRLRGGVLTLNLDARIGLWSPHGPRGADVAVPALGEAGRRLQIPSPMIRVPAGTEVVVTVTNSLGDTLTMHGLVSRPVQSAAPVGIAVAPGATREIRFRLDAPGTYYYWGTTMGRTFVARTKDDAQLNGAIVVDAPGTARPRDRVFVLGQWSDTTPTEMNPDALMRRFLLVVNGRSWPHTERLSHTVGDTVRWRMINASSNVHPMHLHGFYFGVESRGDGTIDSVYAAGRRDLAVTERMRPGSTFSMAWIPERAGNWLFHCHFTSHFSPRGPLGERLDESAVSAHASHSANHAEEAMSGLVMGVTVSPPRGGTRTRTDVLPRRRLRMLVRASDAGTERSPAYAIALHESGAEPPVDHAARAGPPLVLERDVPVAITVVNRTAAPTAIHWHGIELESYFDGVAGFSGSGRRLSPLVAAGDSFEVHMTPPRAGTFIYHTHVDEMRQQLAGLSGALIVLESGASWSPSTDIPVLVSSPRGADEERRAVLVNGSVAPAPVAVRVGMRHRLRLINITIARPSMVAELRREGALLTWVPVAKDGADLPEARRRQVPARQIASIGETFDFEFVPHEAGEYRLELKTSLGAPLATLSLVAAGGDDRD